MRNQKGFTLIELIIVIVVLGILAVTAAPQFINFSGDARESTIRGLKGALQGAAQTTYAKASIEGELDESGELDLNGDDSVDVTLAYGYPTADADGIVAASNIAAVQLVDGYDETQDWVYRLQPDSIAIAPAGTFSNVDLSSVSFSTLTGESCYAQYTQTESNNVAPTVTVVTTGCGN
ncbi:type II secretion system protein [Idiomarina seosinensis]|uniref:type II secretion system protein n=1 Tax=Idiomarina seosinensis TaxID=281739 RepID=UPI00384B42ED